MPALGGIPKQDLEERVKLSTLRQEQQRVEEALRDSFGTTARLSWFYCGGELQVDGKTLSLEEEIVKAKEKCTQVARDANLEDNGEELWRGIRLLNIQQGNPSLNCK